METIPIQKFNETYIRFGCDAGLLMELQEHFTFMVDGYKFNPKYKMGVWDGAIRLVNLNNRTLYAGLYDDVVEFCKAREYKIELVDSPAYGLPGEKASILPEQVKEFVDDLNIHSKGEKLEIRDYQYHAIYKCIKDKRQTILSSTGSGKSLIIYSVTRWVLEEEKRVLIVTPSTQLCHQMKGDFIDYSSENGYDVETNTHLIMAGKEKRIKHPIVISTWQSLMHMPTAWFNQFDAVIVDECHQAKATELSKMMEKCTDISYRWGFTGSLDKSKTNQMVIKGLFGPVTRVSSTKKLIEAGHLSDIEITCLVLDYSPETKSLFKGKIDYQKEIDFIVSHDRRNKFIRNLALSLDGNTLILYTLVEKHGEVLYNMIVDKAGQRPVHFIHGGVDSEDRDAVRAIIEQSNNSITIASAGTMSTGVNIRNLHNIIFASPTKSVIRVLQSLGRGLRKASGKTHLSLYDIADRLNKSKTKSNHTYRHLIERLKIYVDEEFEYKIVEVKIE